MRTVDIQAVAISAIKTSRATTRIRIDPGRERRKRFCERSSVRRRMAGKSGFIALIIRAVPPEAGAAAPKMRQLWHREDEFERLSIAQPPGRIVDHHRDA